MSLCVRKVLYFDGGGHDTTPSHEDILQSGVEILGLSNQNKMM